jgi:hypothetical protein
MDGNLMVLSSDANKRSSYAFGESIRDPRWRRKGWSGRARLVPRLFYASHRFHPMAASGDKRAMRRTLIT